MHSPGDPLPHGAADAFDVIGLAGQLGDGAVLGWSSALLIMLSQVGHTKAGIFRHVRNEGLLASITWIPPLSITHSQLDERGTTITFPHASGVIFTGWHPRHTSSVHWRGSPTIAALGRAGDRVRVDRRPRLLESSRPGGSRGAPASPTAPG